jgi:hypothetical protein
MRRMGHASTRAAMIYQHATDERDPLIADSISEAIAEWQSGGGCDNGRSDRRVLLETCGPLPPPRTSLYLGLVSRRGY